MNAFLNQHPYLIIAIAIWEIIWKGFALWKAARLQKTYWFAAILIVNSAGLLPILFLILYKKNKV